MLLAIDIGNTNIVLGVFEGTTLRHSWRLTTMRERTGDELGLLVDGVFASAKLDRTKITGVILASVVPPLTVPAQEMVQRYFGVKALVVEATLDTGMPVLYDTPADVGADRIVNGIAAYEKYGRAAKSPLVVVDFGTATTLDAISGAGEYLGGGTPRRSDVCFIHITRVSSVKRTATSVPHFPPNPRRGNG